MWFLITLFAAAFAFVYELFSFKVYSVFMIGMPAIPFLLGVMPCMIVNEDMGRAYNDGVLLLMAGSVLLGILEIYGTSSAYPLIMISLGGILLLAGIAKKCARAQDISSR